MPYKILFHELVLKNDFKKISLTDQRKIFRTIQKKLTLDPISFGKPLAHEFKGYYRLRIDPYRVIYRIEKDHVIVLILKIGLRKDFLVYIDAAKRLCLL
jgi:mRNA interferase RelE/StbE